MKKWEYRLAYLAHRGQDLQTPSTDPSYKGLWGADIEQTLNQYGEEGWEIVSFPDRVLTEYGAEGFALFKRQKDS